MSILMLKRWLCGLHMAALLTISSLVYGNGDGVSWDNYVKATGLFRQNAAPEQILALCKTVLENTDDSFLYARVSLLKAEVLMKQNKVQQAHRIFSELYVKSRELPEALVNEARLRDARLFIKDNQHERAIGLLKTAAASANLFIKQEARLALAWQLADTGNWQSCDSLVANIVRDGRAYEQDERILTLRARLQISQNQPEAAVTILESCRGKIALLYLAQAYELAARPIMAVGVYKKVHDLFPNSPEAQEALFQAGDVFMRSEDWLAAQAQFNRLMMRYPDSRYATLVSFRLGWIHMQLHEYEQALNTFRKAATPENQSHITFMEAECLRKMGAEQPQKLHEALLKYNSLMALYPHSPLAPLAKLKSALVMYQKGDSLNASISLRQFLSLHPKDELAPAATFLLATHLKGQKRTDYFNDILHKYPAGIIYDAALVALQKQDYKRGAYQEVINRKAHLNASKTAQTENDYQRLQHLLLAEANYYLQQYDLAKKEYANASGNFDDDLSQKAALGQAWCLLQTGKLDSAGVVFDNLRKQLSGINYAQASFGLGTVYFRMKRYEDAIQACPVSQEKSLAAESRPLFAKSLYRIGECYYRLQYYAQAIETWQKLVQDYPQSELAVDAQFMVADTYFRANHFDEAIATHQAIQQHYPDSPQASKSLLQLAQCEYNAGQYQAAIADFEKFIRDYPQDEQRKDALDGIQLCYYQLGQTEQATEALEKVIAQSSNDLLAADARFKLAVNHLEAKKYDEAIQAFKEILTLFPGSSYAMDAQFALAKAYVEKGDFHASNKEFSRFIHYFSDSPQLAEAIFNLGIGYFNLESYLSASDHFKQIIEQYQNTEFYPAALQNLGWCFDRLGEKEQALSYFNRYSQEFPQGEDLSYVKLQAARVNTESGNFTEAISTLRSLQQSHDPVIATEAAYNLGMAYLGTQNTKAAQQAFNTAIHKGTDDDFYRLGALSQLASLYEQEQDWKNAVSTYQKLVDSAADEEWTQAARERIKTLTPLLTNSTAQVND